MSPKAFLENVSAYILRTLSNEKLTFFSIFLCFQVQLSIFTQWSAIAFCRFCDSCDIIFFAIVHFRLKTPRFVSAFQNFDMFFTCFWGNFFRKTFFQSCHEQRNEGKRKKPCNRKDYKAFGDPAGIRTPDPLLKRQLLCRLSYRIVSYCNGFDKNRQILL